MNMKIVDLRVVDDSLRTEEGEIRAPTTFQMDVEDYYGDRFTVPVDRDTYMTLHNLIISREPTNGDEANG